MKELVECIAKTLVDDPDGVNVTEVMKGDTLVLELRVSAGDMGKIIGKQGRTAESIRTILNAAARKQALPYRVTLDVVE